MRTMLSFVLISPLLLAGCNNHPLIDDATGYSTYQVIHKVRCEAQETVRAYYAFKNLDSVKDALQRHEATKKELDKKQEKLEKEYAVTAPAIVELNADIDRLSDAFQQTKRRILSLSRELDDLLKNGQPPQEDLRRLQEEIAEARILFNRQKYQLATITAERATLKAAVAPYEEGQKALADLQKKVATEGAPLLAFYGTTMASQFTFEATENNNATGKGSITWPIHLGKLSLAYSVGDKRKRLARRVVKVATNFEDLYKLDCSDAVAERSGRAKRYPVTGRIGMAELVSQYFQIIDNAKLQPAASKETFLDKIQFTTTLNAGVTPSVELNTLSKVAIKSDIDLGVDRVDFHEVVVEIGPAPEPSATAKVSVAKIAIESLPELNFRVVEDPYSYRSGKRQVPGN